MNRRNLIIGFALLLVIALGGLWLYNAVLGETEEASGPIEATPIVLATRVPPTAETVSEEQPTATVVVQEEPTATEVVTEQPTATAETTQEEVPPPTDVSQAAGLMVYQLDQATSEVRFSIFEELRGEPKTVVGVSNQVSGEIAVDLSDLSTAQVGPIQVNARTLVTDADRRNQAIRNFILNTDRYEFVVFTPTEITGLAGSAAPGDSFAFQMTGDLTIRNITQTVDFDVTVTVEAMDKLTGSGSAVIPLTAFNLTIPNVPFVANVEENVTLEIDFFALLVP